MISQCHWRIKDSKGLGDWHCSGGPEHPSDHSLPSVEHCKTEGEWFIPNPPPDHNGVV